MIRPTPSAVKLQISVERSSLDLVVDRLARLGDLEAPADLRSGQDGVALGDAQRLGVGGGEFVAVVKVRLDVLVAVDDPQAPVPQRARGEGIRALAADLEIEARIGLDEALVGGRRG